MINTEFFSNGIEAVEVWPTFSKQVLSRVSHISSDNDAFSSYDVPRDSYDNYLRQNVHAGHMLFVTFQNLLRLQIDGRPGYLLVNGQQNVFYCLPVEAGHPGYVVQAQWLWRERDSIFRWLVLGWEMTSVGDYPNWGSFRPAGTKIFWANW